MTAQSGASVATCDCASRFVRSLDRALSNNDRDGDLMLHVEALRDGYAQEAAVSLDDLVAEPWERCVGCGHDQRHHPLPPGIATTPCAWRGCGCPWFIYAPAAAQR